MDKHPDKYFSSKLSSYRKDPPSGAWDRLNDNLGHVKPKFLWMKLAAGVLLLIVAGFVFFTIGEKPVDVTLRQPGLNISNKSTVDSIIQKPEIKEQPEAVELKSQEVAHNTKNIVVTPHYQKPLPVSGEKPIQQELLQHDDVVEARQTNEEINLNEFSKNDDEQNIPSRVITYTAQEVNKKYLRIKKKEAIVYTEPAKEKHTIGEIASVIKHNSVGIGDLRQMKDDLLSFELFAQNDKTKTQ